jgi:hypothetical protein
MSDDSSISHSFTATPPEAAPALYAFANCEIIPVDNTMALVINRDNGKQQMIAPQVVDALKTCTTFRTLEDHADQLARNRPELKGNRALALEALQQVRDAGLLLAAGSIRERLAAADALPQAPTRAFIITCDRPEAVERLLESLLRIGNLGRHDGLFLVDDSREPANRAANRDAVERFNLRSAKNLSYFGAEEQATLLARLIDELPAHEAGIRFLLDPEQWQGAKTYGRSRTLCLLLSVGCRAIVMDDDILCEAVLPAIASTAGINVHGERKAAFFPDREALMAARRPAAQDPLSGHASLLGQALGAALLALNEGPITEAQLGNGNAAMLNVLDVSAPVLVTQCGSWGDPGTGSVHWALHLGEDSIERLVNAPHGMTAALENRCSWLGCAQPTLHKMAFMSQMTGLDNSHLLPPYFPAFRGEDMLFGTMIEAMHHRGAIVEYPWAVPHLPLDPRNHSIRAPIAGSGGISLFSRYLAARIDYEDASNPEARLQHIADDARRLAARSDADLLLDYRRERGKSQAESLVRLRTQAARARELPSLNWQGYLQRGVEEVSASLQDIQSPTAIGGTAPGATEAELVGEFRRLAQGWAAALEAWPAVREACQRVASAS